MADTPWTYPERVQLYLDTCTELRQRRLGRTGIDTGLSAKWSAGEPWTAEVGDIDSDDFIAFVTTWRQFVMQGEPMHLTTMIGLSKIHVTHETLRGLLALLEARWTSVNASSLEGGFRVAFAVGDHEYSPWEVADLIMHGAVFHRRDRRKSQILADIDPATRTMLEWQFRDYIVKSCEVIDSLRLILEKATQRGWISD